jgi:hypothetical protein
MWVETLLVVGIIGAVSLAAVVIAGGAGLAARRTPTASGRLAVAIFAVGFVSSFVNPSLQQANYPMIVFAVAMLAATIRRDAADHLTTALSGIGAGPPERASAAHAPPVESAASATAASPTPVIAAVEGSAHASARQTGANPALAKNIARVRRRMRSRTVGIRSRE